MLRVKPLRFGFKRLGGAPAWELEVRYDGAVAARRTFALPYDLPVFLAEIRNHLLGGRRIDMEDYLSRFGRLLAGSLLSGEMGRLFHRLRGELRDGERLSLAFASGDLTILRTPWEFLFDGREYWGTSLLAPIYRSPFRSDRAGGPPVDGNLRVLVVIPNPLDLEERLQLDIDSERRRILGVLDGMSSSRRLEIDFAWRATLPALDETLSRGRYHILHYAGHARAQEDGGVAFWLEDERGRCAPTGAGRLAYLLRGHRSLRLLFMGGCETGGSPRNEPGRGRSPLGELFRAVPSTVATMFPMADSALTEFAGSFYAAVAEETPLDEALARARRALFLRRGRDAPEYGAPVLYASDVSCLRFNPPAAGRRKPPAEAKVDPRRAASLIGAGGRFVGRNRERRLISDWLTGEGKRAVLIHGLPGIGKTALAAQTAEDLAGVYPWSFAFRDRFPESLPGFTAALARYLHINGVELDPLLLSPDTPPEVRLSVVAQVLNRLPLLIVFDGWPPGGRPGDADRWLVDLVAVLDGRAAVVVTSAGVPPFFREIDPARRALLALGELGETRAWTLVNRGIKPAALDYALKQELIRLIGGYPAAVWALEDLLSEVDGPRTGEDLRPLLVRLCRRIGLTRMLNGLDPSVARMLSAAAPFGTAVPSAGLKALYARGDFRRVLDECLDSGLLIAVAGGFSLPSLVLHAWERSRRGRNSSEFKEMLAKAADYLGGPERSPEERVRAQGLLVATGRHDLAARLTLEILPELLGRGELFLAQECLDRLPARLAEEDRVRVELGLAEVARRLHRREESLQRFQAAIPTLSSMGRRTELAAAHHQMGLVYLEQGDLDRAEEQFKRSLALKSDGGDSGAVSRSLFQLAQIYLERDLTAPALELYEVCLGLKDQLDEQGEIADIFHQMGIALHRLERLDEAADRLGRALRIAQRTDDRKRECASRTQLGLLNLDRGEVRSAEELLRRSLDIAAELGDAYGLGAVHSGLGEVHMKRRRYNAALESFLLAADSFHAIGSRELYRVLAAIRRVKPKLGVRFRKCFDDLCRKHYLNKQDIELLL